MGILPMSEGLTQTHGQDARATAGIQMLPSIGRCAQADAGKGELHVRHVHSRWGRIPRSWLRLGWAVATSVSEWKRFHSLTLVATSEMKRTGGDWHRCGLVKCPGACPGDLYFRPATAGENCVRAVECVATDLMAHSDNYTRKRMAGQTEHVEVWCDVSCRGVLRVV
jgi:hypothetical protein